MSSKYEEAPTLEEKVRDLWIASIVVATIHAILVLVAWLIDKFHFFSLFSLVFLALGWLFNLLTLVGGRRKERLFGLLSAICYTLNLSILLIVLSWLAYIRMRKLRQAAPAGEDVLGDR